MLFRSDSKITTELLDIGLADVNLRNPRGYTVLHIAARRRDPKIVVSLLTKGARPSDLTIDGRKAVQISKRLTKCGNHFGITEEGKQTPKDRLCIEILEQAERRDPQLGEASVSLAIAGDCQRGKLLYLENRGNIHLQIQVFKIICFPWFTFDVVLHVSEVLHVQLANVLLFYSLGSCVFTQFIFHVM